MLRRSLALCGLLILSACGGDPMRDMPRLQDVEMAEGQGQSDAVAGSGAAAPAPDPAAKPRGGLMGFLRGRADAARSGGAAPKPGDPDYRQVSFGTALPYGEIARTCDAPEGKLGARVDSWPKGGRGYTLYDTAPGGTGLRTFYLTGFADGCPRQFSAALVLFAAPSDYEVIRYGPAGADLPVSSTDTAYEQVKGQVCRVSAGQPCGRRMARLEQDTVFLSVYERFGDNAAWKTILLHDGAVAATDIKN